MGITTGMSAGAAPGQSPVQVKSGWAYIVRPPLWPLGTTPGQRGGVRLASAAPEVHMVLVAEPTVDRIFFIGGRDAQGGNVDCTLTVESIDPPGVPQQKVDVPSGWYVERQRDPLSPVAAKLCSLRYDTLPETHPVRLFLASVQPGGSGNGGVGGGNGSAGS